MGETRGLPMGKRMWTLPLVSSGRAASTKEGEANRSESDEGSSEAAAAACLVDGPSTSAFSVYDRAHVVNAARNFLWRQIFFSYNFSPSNSKSHKLHECRIIRWSSDSSLLFSHGFETLSQLAVWRAMGTR